VSRAHAVLAWLERVGDRLSPIVVKEVRQLGRGRDFFYALHAALLVGLGIAFFGAADALAGNATSGGWTFAALMAVLALLGLVVVPLGAFAMLRNERQDETLELITLTALSPRRVVIGKLLAQAVKLLTLFAGLAPFVAMTFLLGGIDFATILVWMAVLFLWSICASAASLFLSSLVRSRAGSGLVLGVFGIVLLLAIVVIGGPRAIYFVMYRGGMVGPAAGTGAGSMSWWSLAMLVTFCVALTINLVLLAENRLSLPSANRTTALRLGFLGQLILMAAWALSFYAEPGGSAAEALLVAGAVHLALVATFTVTEDLLLPPRVRLARRDLPPFRQVFAPLQPGGANGAIYVLLQMAGLLCVGWLLHADTASLFWFAIACGYICVFSGAPVVVFRAKRPYEAAAFRLRVAVLVLLVAAAVVPDVVAYMFWQPNGLDFTYTVRHVLNPFRTLANLDHVSASYSALASLVGVTGFLAYVVLIRIGAGVLFDPVPFESDPSETGEREPGGANVLS
jgi:hypothetical protein